MEAAGPTFDVSWERLDEAVYVRPVGELDLATLEHFREALSEAQSQGSLDLIIDLRGLRYMDSSGLHELVRVHRRCEQSGSRLALIQGPSVVQRLLSITNLHHYFEFVEPDIRDPSAEQSQELASERGRDQDQVTTGSQP